MAKLDETELTAIVAGELRDAINFIDEEVGPLRAAATDYYFGRPLGNEEEGRSQFITHDVRDTINAMMPSIMRVFFGSDQIVEYTPTGPEDEAFAQQATDYAYHVLNNENDFFNVFYAIAKDSLIRKCGMAKIWWDEKEETTTEEYTGLDEQTLALLQEEEGSKVEVTGTTFGEGFAVDPMTGQQVPIQVPYFDCTVTKTTKKGRVCIMAVPPEELVLSRRDRYAGETFIAHRQLKTVSDLVAMGYDRDEVEMHVTSDDFFNESEEYIARTQYARYENTSTQMNESMRKVLYSECFIRVDEDGDGIAELMKVCMLGENKIIHKEPANCNPFVFFPCDPEPHLSEIQAISKADDLIDVQLLKTSVLRNSLDSLAQTINPRTAILDGQVNVNDVLNNEVGGLIREQVQGAVRPLLTPDTSATGLQMLAYADEVKESRTGMSKTSMGLDADALKSTDSKAAGMIMTASQSQLELTTRILANGMKMLFKKMLRLIVTHQDQPTTIRLRGQWIPIDPRQWNAHMDVKINVALGTGSNEEKFNILAGVAAKQEQIIQTMGPNNPLVSLAQYSNTLSRMMQLAGFQNSDQFVTKLPADFQMPPPPPQQDPNAQAAELLAQVEREKAQMKMQVDQAKMQAQAQIDAAKLELEREKFQADMAKKQLELEMQEQKIMAELRMKEAEMVLKQLTQLRGGQENGVQQETQRQEQADAETRQEGLLAQAIQALGGMIAQSQQMTNQALTAPKRVIRDDMGRAVGVQTEVPNDDQIPPPGV